MKKFKPREVNIVDKDKVVMLCGECPGRIKKNSTNDLVWWEMRTGSYIRQLTDPLKNLILTNAYNYSCDTKEERSLAQSIGRVELMDLIITYKPVKVVALGDYAFKILSNMPIKLNIVKLQHPSYILRFKKDRYTYSKKLFKELTVK